MEIIQGATRTSDGIVTEHAAVTGRLQAALDSRRDMGLLEELYGQQAALAWLLHFTLEGPATLEVRTPDRAGIQSEFVAAGQASLDTSSPAYRYALGAYEALRWHYGLRGSLLDA